MEIQILTEKELKARIKKMNISQLARDLGYPRQTIYRFLRGEGVLHSFYVKLNDYFQKKELENIIFKIGDGTETKLYTLKSKD